MMFRVYARFSIRSCAARFAIVLRCTRCVGLHVVIIFLFAPVRQKRVDGWRCIATLLMPSRSADALAFLPPIRQTIA
jgi:hypothetical protein